MAYEHIVLVHYREVSEGRRYNAGSISNLSPGFSSTPGPSFYTAQNPSSSSGTNELNEPYHTSFSPGSVEVSSESVKRKNGLDQLEGMDEVGKFNSLSDSQINQALRRIEEQLSLNDDDLAEELSSYYFENEKSKEPVVLEYEKGRLKEDQDVILLHASEYRVHDQHYGGNAGKQDDSTNSQLLKNAGDKKEHLLQPSVPECAVERIESPSWKDMLTVIDQEKVFDKSNGNEKPLSSGSGKVSSNLVEHQEDWPSQWLEPGGYNGEYGSYKTNEDMQISAARQFLLSSDSFLESPTLTSLLQEVEKSKFSAFSSGISIFEANTYNKMWFDQESPLGIPLGADSSNLIIAQKQRFTISEISPEWGYANENTKVIITGSFLCDPSECAWACMFGDTEVPVEMIQEGVLRCQAPSHIPGKVSVCITSGNKESCSEIKEFEYRMKLMRCEHCKLPHAGVNESTEELLLLVRFAQMLLCVSSTQKEDSIESEADQFSKLIVDEDPWGHIIDALLVGSETASSIMYSLLQELLKDKLQWWLLSRCHKEGDTPGCHLSKKEQGIIHMVAGLGFEWALNPILDSGIGIDFRDVNGWTALHWAARFGREKMVAALLAAGASAGAVTDPTSKDPIGRNPASIAAASGHKGLAGYLSEKALTSHLSSLTLEESELSKGSAVVEAERTVESISRESFGAIDDQLSLKDSLAAVRNAAQAAARIQSAFREHSFRRRQQRDACAGANVDEYGFAPDDINGLSAASKLAFRSFRDHRLDKAALSIQKKYRGWKGRKDFLSLRQKVVKIQAHVRGHQVRKKYKLIVWAVGVLDKVVLRWCRRGVGLRGFRPELESTDESEDEDILKVFRKQKVDAAIEEALSTVLSMVESPDARQQYHRMLECYHQAKAEFSDAMSDTASALQGNDEYMENDMFQFPYEQL
ncbi:PREDICTED: calmodulin-binding transcription activator 4-like isoform X2 [Nelumbo nucifera]|uniref:Calmodulin-binding transcription activator 4-like isoform X2 n=1 Tax=Nelumbo nucifera TaxID=4432 RepID=A0A1U7ZCT6_NELNU|nr:PREDICTED: calmodulin-binding transcription activator 4-like isoform X2 [Nelumbo nucifera]